MDSGRELSRAAASPEDAQECPGQMLLHVLCVDDHLVVFQRLSVRRQSLLHMLRRVRAVERPPSFALRLLAAVVLTVVAHRVAIPGVDAIEAVVGRRRENQSGFILASVETIVVLHVDDGRRPNEPILRTPLVLWAGFPGVDFTQSIKLPDKHTCFGHFVAGLPVAPPVV